MRRAMSALLPAAMAAAALFVAVPAASAAPVHPAAQACYGPSCGQGHVSVSVSYAPDGVVTLTVSGSGFGPTENVQITVTLPTHSAGEFTANGSGAFTGQVTLPAGYARGGHGLDALGTVSGTTASTTFTLTQASGTLHPCTASASTAHSSGVVLAAAYLSATCKSQAPGAAPAALPGAAPASAGGNPSAIVGTAGPQHASQLPFTGSNASTYAAVGALAIGAGGALVLVSRRRRRTAWK